MVPDTSAFVEGVYFTELNWQELADIDPHKPVRLVVPVLVVEELDELKRRRDRVRERARSVLRQLWELNSEREAGCGDTGKPTGCRSRCSSMTRWHVRRPVNDNEIIERALLRRRDHRQGRDPRGRGLLNAVPGVVRRAEDGPGGKTWRGHRALTGTLPPMGRACAMTG